MTSGAALHDAHERNGDDLARKSFPQAAEKLQQRVAGQPPRSEISPSIRKNQRIALAFLISVEQERAWPQKNA
jgi:hypothetical protein